MEIRHGLVIDTRVNQVTGIAERATAVAMATNLRRGASDGGGLFNLVLIRNVIAAEATGSGAAEATRRPAGPGGMSPRSMRH